MLRRPRVVRLLAIALLAVSLLAQSKWTATQLVSFVQSSIRLKHADRQVAEYLRKVTLSERLDPREVEALQGLGAGPATVDALRNLAELSSKLPAPASKPSAVPVPAGPPPPPAAEQRALIERVREYALNYSKRLPNFLATQVTRRYYDPSGLEFWQAQDTLTARLSFFEQRETYQLIMINNRVTDQPFDSVGGATSTGEFGSMMQQLFEPATRARFTWMRWATLRGRRAHVYGYRVEQSNSKWRLNFERTEEVIVGYTGLIYVDRESEMILKLTIEAVEIPTSFPISQATTALDYDFTKIGDVTHLLPLRAEVRMRNGKLLTRNLVEFHLYRMFGADTSIKFETPDALPEDATKEQPLK
jgi:hypothetical protein